MKKKLKQLRHRKILDIISRKEIETQEELAEELKREGIDVTQATVSRDIKELRLIKVPVQGNRYKYAVPGGAVPNYDLERLQRVFSDAVRSVEGSENLVVIKTFPGLAQGVASAVDNAGWQEILGTVAGDDTIIVVVRNKKDRPMVERRFRQLMLQEV